MEIPLPAEGVLDSGRLWYNLTGKIMDPLTTKMSSRGQVVIPEPIRTQLGLEPGTEFVVVAKDDLLVFKQLSAPSWEQFESLVGEARRQAREAGLSPRHIRQSIAKVRRSR
jgi:AbrB family looped-hinge helix DNA binding protein